MSKACGKSRQKHLLHEPVIQEQVQELKQMSRHLLSCQADAVIQHTSAVTQGPSSLEAFNKLDFESIISELQVQAPDLYALFMSLGDDETEHRG